MAAFFSEKSFHVSEGEGQAWRGQGIQNWKEERAWGPRRL
jgi:hypothetical protein